MGVILSEAKNLKTRDVSLTLNMTEYGNVNRTGRHSEVTEATEKSTQHVIQRERSNRRITPQVILREEKNLKTRDVSLTLNMTEGRDVA